MVDNKVRWLAPKSSHRPGPALPKFCTQEERKIPKAMNTKQAGKKHKKASSLMSIKVEKTSAETFLIFLTCAPFLSYPILKYPTVALLATQTTS